jgi:hypothetical protein
MLIAGLVWQYGALTRYAIAVARDPAIDCLSKALNAGQVERYGERFHPPYVSH